MDYMLTDSGDRVPLRGRDRWDVVREANDPFLFTFYLHREHPSSGWLQWVQALAHFIYLVLCNYFYVKV